MLTKLIGSEEHKPLLIALLNALLELPPDRQIEEVTHLREEQRPRVEALKRSIVDVKCRDVRGAVCVVETQVLNVEGFEKRVVYNASKVRERQAGDGDQHPTLDDGGQRRLSPVSAPRPTTRGAPGSPPPSRATPRRSTAPPRGRGSARSQGGAAVRSGGWARA